jgi:hypothetical protein
MAGRAAFTRRVLAAGATAVVMTGCGSTTVVAEQGVVAEGGGRPGGVPTAPSTPDIVVASRGDRAHPSPSADPRIAAKSKLLREPLRESKAPPCPSSDTYVESLPWAADKIREAGRTSRYFETFTGVVLCDSLNRVAVFRVDRDPTFDRAVKQIVASEGAEVIFVDAEISYAEMLRLTKEIRNREPELKANDAPIDSISRHPEGYVIVGISGDLDAARQILSDLLDDVELKLVGASGPV